MSVICLMPTKKGKVLQKKGCLGCGDGRGDGQGRMGQTLGWNPDE